MHAPEGDTWSVLMSDESRTVSARVRLRVLAYSYKCNPGNHSSSVLSCRVANARRSMVFMCLVSTLFVVLWTAMCQHACWQSRVIAPI